MKKALALAAISGLTGAAAAQTLVFDADVTSVVYGGTITWTVRITGVGAGNFLSGYDFNLNSNDSTLGTASAFATALSIVVNPSAGVGNGADVDSASGGQSSLLDAANLTLGDVTIGTFTVIAGNADGFLSYGAPTDGGDLASVNTIRTRMGSDFGAVIFNGIPQVSSDSVRIFVPTPASAALLGLGGLVVARRRR